MGNNAKNDFTWAPLVIKGTRASLEALSIARTALGAEVGGHIEFLG